jgi:hypothetical protein
VTAGGALREELSPLPRAERVEAVGPSWVWAGSPSALAVAWALIGLLSLAAAALLQLDSPALSLFACPIRAATAVPCPGCGGTHAFLLLAHGDAAGAFFASPLWASVALGLWLHAGLTLLRLLGLRRALVFSLPAEQSRMARWLAGGLLLANWAFVVFVSRGGAR